MYGKKYAKLFPSKIEKDENQKCDYISRPIKPKNVINIVVII